MHGVVRRAFCWRLVIGRVERKELLLVVVAGAIPDYFGDLVDLEIHGPGSVGYHVVFTGTRGEVDAISAPGKQVHCRRAEERELGGTDRLLQAWVLGVEDRDDLQLWAGTAAHGLRESTEICEQVATREREIFAQESIALETSRPIGKQRLFVVEPEWADACISDDLSSRLAGAARTGNQRHGVAHQQLIQAHGYFVTAAQEDGQIGKSQPVHVQPGCGAQPQPKGRLAFPRKPERAEIRQEGRVFGADKLQGPESHVVSRPVFTSGLCATADQAAQHSSTRDAEPVGQSALGKVGLQLKHRHRRRGGEKVGVDHLHEVLAETRELSVDLELDSRCQESKGLEQTLHVRVGTLKRLDAKTACNLGEFVRKLPAHFP